MRRAIAILLLSMATVASAVALARSAMATSPPNPASIKQAIMWIDEQLHDRPDANRVKLVDEAMTIAPETWEALDQRFLRPAD